MYIQSNTAILLKCTRYISMPFLQGLQFAALCNHNDWKMLWKCK